MSYCEYPEFYHETFPKARKPHRCCECSAPIEVGEEHLYYRGKWDGEFDLGRQHMVCRELCMFIRDNFQSGECFGFGELAEVWSEMNCASHWWNSGRSPRPIFSEDDKLARKLMAQVKWRKRKHRTIFGRKIDGITHMRFKRKWGQSWEART